MLFTKEELSFISIFAKCSDNKKMQNDKFRIKASEKDQEVVFSQFSDGVVLIKTLNKKVEKDFEVIFPVNQFLSLISSIPNEASLDIKSNGIDFNGNKYEFETFDFSSVFIDTEAFKNAIKGLTAYTTVDDFLNLKNTFMGLDGFDCTLLVDGNFISAPGDNSLVCSYKTGNDKNTLFYIPKLAALIGIENKYNSLSFYDVIIGEQKYITIGIKDVDIIFLVKEYQLPNILEDEYTAMYEHENKIEFNRDILKESLSRITIFSQKNIFTRIRCSTTNNQFIIESKEPNSGYAVEKIEACIDKDLLNKENLFCVSQADLNIAVNALKGKSIIIKAATSSKDAAVIKVTDETENNFFLIRYLPE